VADVRWGDGEQRYTGRFNGKRGRVRDGQPEDGQNIFAVRDGILPGTRQISSATCLRAINSSALRPIANVANRLGHLTTDFAIAIALVLLTLLPLGLRASSVVMISIPLSARDRRRAVERNGASD